ncbi:MAG: RluA family pseudouridine synthase [Deltaproteobacteria bacterium]|nr:RluA family pseudouridine synthase [Deltaproteobacteria bacterium]
MKTQPQILHEDNHLLVLCKPSCMPSVPDATHDQSILEWARTYLKDAYNKPGNVFLGVVHRLDRPVSGIICFAKTSKAASRLFTQMQQGLMQKTYLAVVQGAPTTAQGEYKSVLLKDTQKNKVTSYSADTHIKNGLLAHSHWQVLHTQNGLSLLSLTPITGRPHQLRVHCAELGCPIVGDVKYGPGPALPDGSICLHAWRLTLVHPTRKEGMEFTVPPPETEAWRTWPDKSSSGAFRECLT